MTTPINKEMPERVWLNEELYADSQFSNDEVGEEQEEQYRKEHPFRDIEYIRSDLFDKLQSENDSLKTKLTGNTVYQILAKAVPKVHIASTTQHAARIVVEEIASLNEKLAEAEKLLREIEWGGADNGVSYCVFCYKEPKMHSKDCELSAFLASQEKGEKI